MENVNYSNGQSDVSKGALTLRDVEETVGGPSPRFTIKEKRCPRNGNVVGAVYKPVAASLITRRDLQSAVNKRLCDNCRMRKACAETDSCDYCTRWCENREKEETDSVKQEPVVGETPDENNGVEEPKVSMASRFGDPIVGQANDEPASPKFYVLGRLDSIMAIEIISKILGVQNPGDIKQLLILASTKSDNPPVFGPSMHNISPEKAMVLTHALNNELDKLRSERPDGVLTNEELNRALERAIEGLENNTLVGEERKDEETVACSKEKKDKEDIVPVYPVDNYYRHDENDVENVVGSEVTDIPEEKSVGDDGDETVACSKEKKMKEDIVPIYPIDTYASSYRHENTPDLNENEVKNPEVIEDTPEMPVGVNLEARVNKDAVAEDVVGENSPRAEDLGAASPDKGVLVVGENRPIAGDAIKEEVDAVPPVGNVQEDVVSEPHHKHHKKFPKKQHHHHEHYNPHGQYYRAEGPLFEDKFQQPSAAHMSDNVRQVTLPLTTERILAAVPEEEATLHLENERPLLESANHFGIPDDAPLLQENGEQVPQTPPTLGGQIANLVESQIHQNDGNGFTRNDENSFAPGTNLGRDIVKVVKENMDNPEIKQLPKLMHDKVHDAQENFKNFLHNLKLEQPDIFHQLQNHRNLENVGVPETVEGPRIEAPAPEGTGIAPEMENFGEETFEPVQPEMVAAFVPEQSRNTNDLMNNMEQVESENPDKIESRMELEKEDPSLANNELVSHQQLVNDEVNNHFGKIVPAEGNFLETTQPSNNVFFLGNGIKLPLQMRKNEDGSMDISVDLEKLCSCQNSTCPKFHNENIVETVGTILEKEAELKDQLDSIDAGNTGLPETTNINNKQMRRDLNAVNDGNGAGEHMEMFKRASNPFIASSNAAKMSQFLSNDMLSTTPKYPTLSEIVQMRDMYKYKKLEDELKSKLQVLNRNVEQYKDQNTKLLSKGAQTIFKTNDENNGVQQQMDIVNNVLGWMKNVALTNTK